MVSTTTLLTGVSKLTCVAAPVIGIVVIGMVVIGTVPIAMAAEAAQQEAPAAAMQIDVDTL